jgi:hypothetical protein
MKRAVLILALGLFVMSCDRHRYEVTYEIDRIYPEKELVTINLYYWERGLQFGGGIIYSEYDVEVNVCDLDSVAQGHQAKADEMFDLIHKGCK